MFSKKINLSLIILFVLSLLLFNLTGCSSATDTSKENKKANDKVINSTDGKFQISIPEEWETAKDLHHEAVLQVAHKTLEKYLIVLSEPKSDFANDIKLDDYLKAVNKNFTESMTNVKISEAKDITLNGLPAKQYEVTGEADKVKVAYLVTLVQAPNSFNQIMAWTLQSKFSEYKTELAKVTNSFKEIK